MNRYIKTMLVMVLSAPLLCAVSYYTVEPGFEAYGGANKARIENSTAVRYNPASLPYMTGDGTSLYYHIPSTAKSGRETVLDSSYAFLSFGKMIAPKDALGISLVSSVESGLDGRDASGVMTGEFSSIEENLDISYGKLFSKYLSLGLKTSFRYTRIANYQYVSLHTGLALGINIKQALYFSLLGDDLLSTRGSLIGSDYRNPRRFAASVTFAPGQLWSASATAGYVMDGQFFVNAGTAMRIRRAVSFYIDYENYTEMHHNVLENKGTLDGNYSTVTYFFRELGGGLAFTHRRTTFDYSLKFHRELGLSHNIGVSLKIK